MPCSSAAVATAVKPETASEGVDLYAPDLRKRSRGVSRTRNGAPFCSSSECRLQPRWQSWAGSAAMARRYQHLIDSIRRDVAKQVGGLLWNTDNGEAR